MTAGPSPAAAGPYGRALHRLRQVEAAVAAALLAAVVAVVFGGALARFAGTPQIWTEELAQVLFVWLAMLAADYTLQRAGHFRIDLLTRLLPVPLQRALDILIQLMVAALLATLVWHGRGLLSVAHPRPLPMLGLPSSVAVAALPVAYLLMLVTTIEHLVDRVAGRHHADAPARDLM